MKAISIQYAIDILENYGFEKVSVYDIALDYWYFDAYLNNVKVEVRVGDKSAEWRHLGANSLENIEWFFVGTTEENLTEENEEMVSI